MVVEKKILKFSQCIFAISFLSLLEKGHGPSSEQTWIPFAKEYFVPNFVEIGQVVLEKKNSKFRQCFFTISWLSPLGKERGPSFDQSWIPFTQGCFMQSLVEIGSVVLEKKIFLSSSMYFSYFIIISPWIRGPIFWTNLNSLHPRILCAKFGWNWPSGSGEEDLQFRQCTFDIS